MNKKSKRHTRDQDGMVFSTNKDLDLNPFAALAGSADESDAGSMDLRVQLDKKQISFEAWETFQLHVDKNISSFKSRPTNANGVPLMHFAQLETEQKEFIEKMGSWWSEFHEAVEKGEI